MPRLGSKKIKALLSECLGNSSCNYVIEGENPMLLVLEDRAFTVFLKPIGDVCYSNKNESTRVQLPKRDYFDKIKASKRPFLLMGFDLVNKVFVIWNPNSTKERLNTKKNLSFYCRLDAQREANEKQVDNIGDLVPPVAVFWYRRFTLSDFSYRISGTAPESVL